MPKVFLAKSRKLADRPHVLYRFWDSGDVLLYVGLTVDPGQRWKAHSKDKGWWSEVARVTVEHFADRASVEAAERLAVATENPRYNIALPSPPRKPKAGKSRPASIEDDDRTRVTLDGWLALIAQRGLDHMAPTPLYLQVADHVQREIEAGKLEPNRLVPGENVMVQTYDVSRGTIRKAVGELRRRGLVFTVPQRGTYVSPAP